MLENIIKKDDFCLSRKEKVFFDYLKKNKMNITLERRALFNIILNQKNFFSIKDIIELSKKSKIPSSRATVYRIVKIFYRLGFVRKVFEKENHIYYENINNIKSYLYCVNCNEIIEININNIEKKLEDISKIYDFEPFCKNIKIDGLCSKCRNK